MPRECSGTVGEHRPEGGWVALDDGTRLSYAGTAVAREVRVLHPGQRVRLRLEGPDVLALTLAGLLLPD